ncbi:MAG: SOS response-associated peptidase [Thermoleophilaceae bacterium]
MCGRFTNTPARSDLVAARYGIQLDAPIPSELLGRANICPTDPILAVVLGDDRERHAVRLRWGLAPAWAKLKGGPLLINARDDKIRSNGAWRPLASSALRRCLVVADGWLEWQKPEDPKQPRQPFLHRLRGGEGFAFAGLWTIARPRDSEQEIASAAIITTRANGDVRFVHDRMPAILDGNEGEAAWLDPAVGLDAALDLIGPLDDGSLEVLAVGPAINSSQAEGLDLLEPLTA